MSKLPPVLIPVVEEEEAPPSIWVLAELAKSGKLRAPFTDDLDIRKLPPVLIPVVEEEEALPSKQSKLNDIIKFSDATTLCDEAQKNNNKTSGQGHFSPPSARINQSACIQDVSPTKSQQLAPNQQQPFPTMEFEIFTSSSCDSGATPNGINDTDWSQDEVFLSPASIQDDEVFVPEQINLHLSSETSSSGSDTVLYYVDQSDNDYHADFDTDSSEDSVTSPSDESVFEPIEFFVSSSSSEDEVPQPLPQFPTARRCRAPRTRVTSAQTLAIETVFREDINWSAKTGITIPMPVVHAKCTTDMDGLRNEQIRAKVRNLVRARIAHCAQIRKDGN
ncbi:hypothetical protein DPMN_044507 [Dreissena polymorpha]|uniref:Uncharacterized protein n=1 Tax=Dreissena polymorpha TaxID=45954 RepID=A0A9D4D4A9_DREPO|nr:hypothetical protein DPMN_044507 [Dreissena polymorpha]